MSDSILRLQSAAADVVIKTRPFAEIIYWGPHLSHFTPQDAASIARPVANGRLDVDSPVTLMAELGHGLFGAPGIEGHRQGLDASPMFTTTEVVQDGQNLTLLSEDAQAGLRPPGGHAAGRRARPRSHGLSWPLDPRISAPSSDP